MATPWLNDSFKPLALQGTTHLLPQKFNEWIIKFSGDNIITAREHLNAFSTALDDNAVGEHEDVAVNLFVKSLEGDPASWFKRLPEKSIKGWNDLITPFLKICAKVDSGSLLVALQQIKKVRHESVIEFNVRFQKLLGRIPDNAKLAEIVTLTFYLNAFDPQFGLSLKEKEPKYMQDAMEKAISLEGYMVGFHQEPPPHPPQGTTQSHNTNPLEESNLFARLCKWWKTLCINKLPYQGK